MGTPAFSNVLISRYTVLTLTLNFEASSDEVINLLDCNWVNIAINLESLGISSFTTMMIIFQSNKTKFQ